MNISEALQSVPADAALPSLLPPFQQERQNGASGFVGSPAEANTWELQFGAWMRILIDAPERIIIIADKRILALFNTMLYTAKC